MKRNTFTNVTESPYPSLASTVSLPVSRRHGQVDLTGGVSPGLLVLGDLEDARVDQPVDVGVGRSLREPEILDDVPDGCLTLAGEIGVQPGQTRLPEKVRDREEIANEVAVGPISGA